MSNMGKIMAVSPHEEMKRVRVQIYRWGAWEVRRVVMCWLRAGFDAGKVVVLSAAMFDIKRRGFRSLIEKQ